MALFQNRTQQPGTITLPDSRGTIVVPPGGTVTIPDDIAGNLADVLQANWVQVVSIPTGTTAQRPTGAMNPGTPYYDTTIGKPVWWNGAAWKDATGVTV